MKGETDPKTEKNLNQNNRLVRGFSLIEIAIVLFIVSLVMSGIVALVNAMVVNRQIESTRTKQEAIKTALISFVARNYRLPCPALPNLAESAANNGVEAIRDTNNKLCTELNPAGSGANQVVTGVVPWVSLGLTNENALDAYANRFTYQVVLSAAFLDSPTVSGMTGWITIHSAGRGKLGDPLTVPASNQKNYCSGTVNPCAGVVAIVSHGKDGYGAYTRSGSQIPFDSSVTGNDAKENVFDLSDLTKPPDSRFVVKDYSGTDTNPFDDIVMALTTNDLLAPLVIAGTLKDPRAALNAKFDRIKYAVVLNAIKSRTVAIICSSGSCPPHDSCMVPSSPCGSPSFNYPIPAPGTPPNTVPAALGLSDTDTTDSWGFRIIYTGGGLNIDSSTSASTPVFTLRSNGPDGDDSTAGDNFEVSVTASEIIGLIARAGL